MCSIFLIILTFTPGKFTATMPMFSTFNFDNKLQTETRTIVSHVTEPTRVASTRSNAFVTHRALLVE